MTTEPQKTIHLNLDQFDRDTPDSPPFVFVLGGRTYELNDPKDVTWQDLLDIEGPADFARHCMSREDRTAFLAHPMRGRTFNALFTEFQEHFDIKAP